MLILPSNSPCNRQFPVGGISIYAQSAEDLSQNLAFYKRSKHIKYHWISEHVDPDGCDTARVVHVESTDRETDLITRRCSVA